MFYKTGKYLPYLIPYLIPFHFLGWGFKTHRLINKQAIFSLPVPLIFFYKNHLTFITEESIRADKRRYIKEEEGSFHFIDLEFFTKSKKLPTNIKEAEKIYGKEKLQEHGQVPWKIISMMKKLTQAFKEKNRYKIANTSADIGHYMADLCVPLHTTENYNGQKSQQEGIHSLWETLLPHLFAEKYNLFVGKAHYIKNPSKTILQELYKTHRKIKFLLQQEKKVRKKIATNKRYGFYPNNKNLTINYSYDYADTYHQLLEKQVEKAIQQSIIMVASIWYTCWVDAGRPKLNKRKRSIKHSPSPRNEKRACKGR